MNLGRRTDIDRRTDTNNFILQNVHKGQQPVFLQLQKPHAALYCGARTEKHALKCLSFPMQQRKCAVIKSERKRLYDLCLPTNTTVTASYSQHCSP